MTLSGCDVSNYQPNQDFGPYAFAIVKATEGNGFLDRSFVRHWNLLKSQGKVRGAYHFARPDLNNTPEAEADWHCSQVRYDPGDLMALDFEVSWGDPVGWSLRFLNRVAARAGLVPGIYINGSTMNGHDWSPVVRAGYWLWLAAYDGNQNVPAFRHWPAIAFKQYNDRPIDLDCFFGDRATLLKYGKGGVSSPVTNTITDTVHPGVPVSGKIFQNATWFNWDDLSPLQTTDQTGSTGASVVWSEAKLVGGIWYDRISNGAWALNDADIDDGGHDPTFFRPTPTPPPAPAPTPVPVPTPSVDVFGALARLVEVETALMAARKALGG
jgi:GH25 family lysozyme M1 (1,4-beta-N-acetylmuramidase)